MSPRRQLGREPLQLGLASGDQDEMEPGLGEPDRELAADAGGRPGHHRPGAVPLQELLLPPSSGWHLRSLLLRRTTQPPGAYVTAAPDRPRAAPTRPCVGRPGRDGARPRRAGPRTRGRCRRTPRSPPPRGRTAPGTAVAAEFGLASEVTPPPPNDSTPWGVCHRGARSAASRSNSALRRATRTRWSPASASRTANSRPMPEDAPVTTAQGPYRSRNCCCRRVRVGI